MKVLILATALIFTSTPAIADQIIICLETYKDGSLRRNGATLKAALAFASGSEIQVDSENSRINLEGVWRRGAEFGRDLRNIRIDQSKTESGLTHTQLKFEDAIAAEIEYQLGFSDDVVNKKFKEEKATLVIGPAGYLEWHFLCSSKVN